MVLARERGMARSAVRVAIARSICFGGCDDIWGVYGSVGLENRRAEGELGSGAMKRARETTETKAKIQKRGRFQSGNAGGARAALDACAAWAACRRRRQSRRTPKVLCGLIRGASTKPPTPLRSAEWGTLRGDL